MDILCLGQQNWDHCWTDKQHLTTRLAERGHRILYVDPDAPTREEGETARSASSRRVPGLQHRGPRDVWTYTSLVPASPPAAGANPVLRKVLWKLLHLRRERALQRALRAVGFHAPVTLCFHPRQIHVLRSVNAQALVYYAVDEYTAYSGMTDDAKRCTRGWEEEILAQAEVALGVSSRLRDRFAAICPASYVLENGSDVDHFRPEKLARIAPHPGVAKLNRPVIGFIGQIDARIDQDLLAEVAHRRPGWTFALAGRRTVEMPRLDALANVRFLGFQSYEDLPSLAKGVDVWTVPYVQNDLTHACNPAKVYEYLATGIPVVSRPLDGLVVCRDVLRLAEGPDEFIAATETALADPGSGRAERMRRAEKNDWYARTDALEAHLEEAIRRARENGRWLRAMSPLPPARLLRRGVQTQDQGLPDRRGRVSLLARIVGTWLLGKALRGGRPPSRPRRILVAWRGYLGDLIALTPMLAHLRRTHPDARISLGLRQDSSGRTLFAQSPDIDDFAVLEFASRSIGESEIPRRERFRRMFSLVAKRFDLIVGSGHDHFLPEGLLGGAPRYVGFYDRWMQGLMGRALRRDPGRHEAENDLALAEAITGSIAEDSARQPRLHFDEAEVAEKRKELLEALSIEEREPVLLVHPGSKRASRRWPAERLAETMIRVLDRRPELIAIITGTEGERPLAESLLRRMPERLRPRIRDAAGRSDLAALAGLLDRADVVLSYDTGIMHFARTRGAPLVAVLGPENHKLWGPHPQGDAPVRAIRREVPCAPCILETCAPHYCLRSVPVEDVERAVLELLDLGREAGVDSGRLQLDFERRSWSALARDGFDLPLVSVIVDAVADREALAAALPIIERQTYPRMEIVHVLPQDATWRDPRELDRQKTLPIVAVRADGPDRAWAAAVRAARGDLLVRATRDIDWRPSRLALDVAAATRTPNSGGMGFFDSRPLTNPDARRDALVHRPSTIAQAGSERASVRPPAPAVALSAPRP